MDQKKSIVLYLHVHQPYRLRHYTVFDTSNKHDYFNNYDPDFNKGNKAIFDKVSQKSYLPTNKILKELLDKTDFKISLSITGVILDQMKSWSSEVLNSFKDLVATGKVEILAETYHHSLAFFYSKNEFEKQVEMHQKIVQDIFGVKPMVFRNTELTYNNDLGYWADQANYKGIITEGWDPILGWRNPNHVYRPAYTRKIKLLLKNYRLSDDLAFRFGDRAWSEWPLSVEKYCHWMSNDSDSSIFNLFMDYETFGEHQWQESGIFDFLSHLPDEWLKDSNHKFMTVSEAIDSYDALDTIDVPNTITWADTERDLSAWIGNSMQVSAIKAIYELEEAILATNDFGLIEDWRKLQTSDHFYYMSTKYFNDGDIHSYFSPFANPYEAFMNYMNVYHDLKYRISEKGLKI